MIKVMHLIDGGFIGGGQMHTLSLCRNLSKEKFHSIVCAYPKGGFKEAVFASGFEFIDIELPKIFRTKYLSELERKVDRENVTILHAHGGVAGMYARFMKKNYICRAKVVHTLHGIHYIHSKNMLRKYGSLYIEQYLAGHSDAYICETESDFETAKRHKIIEPSSTTVINNGIETGKYARKSKDEHLMRQYGITKEDFIIGNVSRFDEQKNQKLLIKAMPEILSAMPESKLLLIGDGKLLEDSKRLAINLGVEERVIFTGERKDLEKFYPLMDIFALPSLWEGLSLTLLEAMASGRCILAGKIPSNSEVIEDGISGILFPPESKNDFLEKILMLFNDREMREKISENAGKTSLKYDEKEMTLKTEEVYLKVINEQGT